VNLYDYFYGLVIQIPRGMVSTYGALARALGDIRASRACGVMLSQNPDPPRIPCHRVVMSDGSIGGFTHPEGIKRKIELLRKEGVYVKDGKIVNFKDVLFEDFKTDYPLKKLREEQERMRGSVILEDDFSAELVGGVDVSYEGRRAFGALVIMDSKGRVREIIKKDFRVDFPYIPTYLAFREEPVISSLLKELDEEIVLLVDGNGILHPLNMGLATYVGVKNNIPTIGVAKSLLMGEVINSVVYLNNIPVGYEIKKFKRGIYISPGHRVSLESSLLLVKNFLRYKVPEPLRLAHIEANKLRKFGKF
jgi:deoxyribonuclease V